MKMCEECRAIGRTGERATGYKHRLPDGQRVTLCISHAKAWAFTWRDFAPRPYGPEARAAYDAVTIVGVTA